MKKTKTLFTLFAIFCLSITAAFTLSACETNHADSVAGTYIYEYVSDYKQTTTLTVNKKGNFTLESKTYDGGEYSEAKLTGNLIVDENKQVTSIKCDDILTVAGGNEYLFGMLLPSDYDAAGDEETLILKLIGDKIADIISAEFSDDYMILGTSGSYIVLYKDGATKIENGTVIRFNTEKQLNQNGSIDLEALIFGIESKSPQYESDYYFVKDQYALTTDEGMAEFIEELEYSSEIIRADKFGDLESAEPEIVEVTGFDLTAAGTRNGVIKYKSGDNTVQKTVSYTVVEKEDELPLEQLYSFELRYASEVNYVAKGTKLYEKDWELGYTTFNSKYSNKYLNVNEENCVGENKVIDIIGYDETQTGVQTVTLKFRDEEIKCTVFVYDDTVNPVINAYITGNAVIDKNGDNYTMDCSRLQFKLTKADGSVETITTVTQEQAVNLIDLKDYDEDDDIVFAYEYQFGGQTYTFYCETSIIINTIN